MASDELSAQLSPLLAAEGLELFDVEVQPGLIRVTVDRPGGVDLDALAVANRTISSALDALDPMPGRYSLEVSSPGVERRLRTPEHFRRSLGASVSVRTLPDADGPRRVTGELTAADAEGFEVRGPEVPGGEIRLRYDEVERARTVFTWGPAPRQRPATSPGSRRGAAARTAGPGLPPSATNATTERASTP